MSNFKSKHLEKRAKSKLIKSFSLLLLLSVFLHLDRTAKIPDYDIAFQSNAPIFREKEAAVEKKTFKYIEKGWKQFETKSNSENHIFPKSSSEMKQKYNISSCLAEIFTKRWNIFKIAANKRTTNGLNTFCVKVKQEPLLSDKVYINQDLEKE